jgi:hypothetical protein
VAKVVDLVGMKLETMGMQMDIAKVTGIREEVMEMNVHMADIREVMGTKVGMVAIKVVTHIKEEAMAKVTDIR